MSDEDQTLNLGADSSNGANSGADAGSQESQQQSVHQDGQQQGQPGAAANTPGAATGDQSKPKDDKKPSLRDVVTAALAPKGGAPSDATKSLDPTLNPDGTKKDGATGEQKSEEDQRLDKNPRFQEVIKERNALREQAKATEVEVADYRKIVGYIGNNGLNAEEFNKGLQIMALLKNDPAAAARELAPYIASINQFLGITLPQDLAQAVEQGLVTPEHARALASQRMQLAHMQQRSQTQQVSFQQQQQALIQRQQQEVTQRIQGSVATWEEQKKKTDPDFGRKYESFVDAIKVALMEGQPRTTEEAIQLAERTYAAVSKRFSGVLPARQPMKNIDSTNPSGNTGAKPANSREAVVAAFAKSS